MIGVDADIGRNVQGLFHHLAGGEVRGVLLEGQRGRLRVHGARADGGHVHIGLQHVAGAAHDEQLVLVANYHHGFELAQVLVFAPVLGQLDGGALEVIAVGGELLLEAVEQHKGIGGRAGEAGHDFTVVELAHFAHVVFSYVLVHRGLAIGPEGNLAVVAHAEHGRGANFWKHGAKIQPALPIREWFIKNGRAVRPGRFSLLIPTLY